MKTLFIIFLLMFLLISCSSIKTENIRKSADVSYFEFLTFNYSSKDLLSSKCNTTMFKMKMNNYTLSLSHVFPDLVYNMNYDVLTQIVNRISDPEIVEIKVYDEKNKIIAEKVYSSVESDIKFVRSAEIKTNTYETIGKVEVVFSPKIKYKKDFVEAKTEFYETVFRYNLTRKVYALHNTGFKSSIYHLLRDFSVVSVKFINEQGEEEDYYHYSNNDNLRYKQTIEKRIDLIYRDGYLEDYLGTVIIVYGIN